MEDSEEDEFLNLSLSVNATASGRKRKNKGKMKSHRQYNYSTNNTPPPSISPYHHELGYEGKIFTLLQTREQMLRQHHNITSNGMLNGLPLIHLLLTTATAVDHTNFAAALDNLTDLYQTVSLTGDSVQRVVAYFADALAAKLLTRNSPFYSMLMEDPTADETFLAFTDLYRVSPYYQFAHFTANQAILEAFEQESETNNRAIHVIDFDVSYGFQWPSLIQSLSEKATNGKNRVSLRITGFGNCLKGLQETESRLLSFANAFSNNLAFEFQGLLRGSGIPNLRKKKNETVAVNLVSYLNGSSGYAANVTVTDTLALVSSLAPSVVVLVKQEGSRSLTTFLSRFTESLHYFAAMFDSLDDCLPLESAERLRIEKKLLGREIKGVLNCDDDVDGGGDCVVANGKYERMEAWKARMEGYGFGGKRMSEKCVMQAKLLLKMRTHYCPLLQFEGEEGGGGGGFRVCERDEGRAISLGWQNRFLLTVSTWQPTTLIIA